MTTQELSRRWGMSPRAIEDFRRSISGAFDLEHVSGGLVVARRRVKNIVTNEGVNKALEVHFAGGAQISTWRLALVKSNTTPLDTMTYASPGFVEVSGSDITETARPVWTPGAVAAKAVNNNASVGVFTVNAAYTAYGLAIVGGGTSPQTIGDVAGGGTLHAFGLFSVAVPVNPTDVLNCTYGLLGDDDGV